MLGLLAVLTAGESVELADALAQLRPTDRDKHQACRALLGLITHRSAKEGVELASAVAQLNPPPNDKRQALQALLGLLAGQTGGLAAIDEASGEEAQLDPTSRDPRRIDALLGRDTIRLPGPAADLVSVLRQLASTPGDQRQVRDALLGLLAHEADSAMSAELIDGVTQLDPVVDDLTTWPAWAIPPNAELLAAVRRNSTLEEWLNVLPSLSQLSP